MAQFLCDLWGRILSWQRNVTTCVSAVNDHNYSANNSNTGAKQPPCGGEGDDHCLMSCLGHRFTPVFVRGRTGSRSRNVRNV